MSLSCDLPKTDRIIWRASGGKLFENNGKGINRPIGRMPDGSVDLFAEGYKAGHVDGFDTGLIVGVVGSFSLGMIAFCLVWIFA